MEMILIIYRAFGFRRLFSFFHFLTFFSLIFLIFLQFQNRLFTKQTRLRKIEVKFKPHEISKGKNWFKKKSLWKINKLIQRSKKIFEIISFHFISNLFQDINGAGILPATHFDLLIRRIFLNLLRISFWQMKNSEPNGHEFRHLSFTFTNPWESKASWQIYTCQWTRTSGNFWKMRQRPLFGSLWPKCRLKSTKMVCQTFLENVAKSLMSQFLL